MSRKNANIYFFAEGHGPPIVVLHGGPGLDHSYLLPPLEPLKQKHRLIFYDQRCSGQSGGETTAEEVSLDRFQSDLEALRKGLDLDQFTLLGHGWGALLALHYAARHPQHLRSLILVCPMPVTVHARQLYAQRSIQARSAEEQEALAKLASSEGVLRGKTDAINAYFALWFRSHFADPAQADQLPFTFHAHTAKNSLLVLSLMLRDLEKVNVDQELPKVTVPTLIVAGDSDLVPVEEAEQLRSALPNAQLAVMQHVGHFPFIESPEALFAHIEEFLSRQSTKPEQRP